MVDGVPVGKTPMRREFMNLIGQSYWVKVTMDGYEPYGAQLPGELKPAALAGGFFFIVPFLFAYGPRPYHHVVLQPAETTAAGGVGPSEMIGVNNLRSSTIDQYDSLFDYVADSVVVVILNDGHGSGFVVGRNGYLLTNEHVVHGSSMVTVRLNDGRQFAGTVLRTNRDTDAALIKIDATDLEPLVVNNGDTVNPGDEIWVIGTPVSEVLSLTVTRGIVSGLRYSGAGMLIQTDASINPGNSGGPILFIDSGEVLAIASAKLVGADIEGIGFGISVVDALRSLGVRIRETE